MRGDFTRNTFDPKKHYNSVLMQQGRVQLDADWNEQADIIQHRIEAETMDVIGPSGVLLNDTPGYHLIDNSSHHIGDFIITGGRCYVDGILCERDTDILYTKQEDWPNPVPIQQGYHLVYLDVWKRHITALEDPAILEQALGVHGGIDTATRSKTIAQVKLMAIPDATSLPECDVHLDDWEKLIKASTTAGMLGARAQPLPPDSQPCDVEPNSGYRGLENQLYRVEIHEVDHADPRLVRFKWSRENGSIVVRCTEIASHPDSGLLNLSVKGMRREPNLGFKSGDVVEIFDDERELQGRSGTLVQVHDVLEQSLIVNVESATDTLDPLKFSGPKIRRWEDAKEVSSGTNSWIELENGIQIKFESGNFRVGDYWLIPARSLSHTVEWPTNKRDDTPQAKPPAGIQHHYCRLAIIHFDGTNINQVRDCRHFFRPLTTVTTVPPKPPAIHVTGTNWQNDDSFSLETLQNEGLKITFDAPPDPSSLWYGSMTVTLEKVFLVQHGTSRQLVHFYQSNLGGYITIDNTSNSPFVTWNFMGSLSSLSIERYLLGMARLAANEMQMQASEAQLLIRVRLNGHTIWRTTNTGREYLDGQTFGSPGQSSSLMHTTAERLGSNPIVEGFASGAPSPEPESPLIKLTFPSGDGAKASDFESWFFVEISTSPPGTGTIANANPLRVSGVSFISVDKSIQSFRDSQLQPDTGNVAHVSVSGAKSAQDPKHLVQIQVSFNRAVNPEGLNAHSSDSQSILVRKTGHISDPHTLAAEIALIDDVTAMLTFSGAESDMLVEGTYALIALSSPQGGAPAITAKSDGTTLNGNFILEFVINST